MEHPAVREIAQALESIGIRIHNGQCYAPCRSCKRTRRWSPAEVSSKRVVNLLFCIDCLRAHQLATTAQSEIIVPN
jgi:hypothetical protein